MLIAFQTDIQSTQLRESRHVAYDWREWVKREIEAKGRIILTFQVVKYELIPDGTNHGHGHRVEATYVVVHYKPEIRDVKEIAHASS